jgi:bifunctional UDP-N-acetylglucosamine pyrophosphorylase/glucosamine-1-phosphate N-acetyltransferase
MRSPLPKVLVRVAGRPLLDHVLRAIDPIPLARRIVVVGHGADDVRREFAGRGVEFAVQREQRGTADALAAAEKSLAGFAGTLLVVYGDTPRLRASSLAGLLETHRASGAAASLLTTEVADPTGYGRILRDEKGDVSDIREEKDASPAEKAIREINPGIYCFEAPLVFDALKRIESRNAQGEFYLTDVVRVLRGLGRKVAARRWARAADLEGVNDAEDLLAASRGLRDDILADLVTAGVDVLDPDKTYVEADVEVGAGTVILPFTCIHSGVRIGRDCRVGPFSRLREGTVLEDGAEVGNFVETKNARLGLRTKALHLAYLGDAEIGASVNIGAGTITANYDGVKKSRTTIRDRAFIGSGVVLVAPVDVGPESVVGAGAVVVRNTRVGPREVFVGVPARKLKDRAAPEGRT